MPNPRATPYDGAMSRTLSPLDSGEAKLHYGDNDLAILTPGSYVLCAQTAEKIPLENLRYWSVERQEPYKDAAAAVARCQALGLF